VIAAPLLDPGGCLGLIVLGRDSPARPFTEDQLDLLVELAGEAALELGKIKLIEGAEQIRALEQQLAWARQIQLSILPAELPVVDGYELYSRNIPSRGVSGDFYSLTFRREQQECVVFMGDVSGKGFPAAMVASSLEALSAVMIEAGDAPADICTKLSRQLFDRTPPSGYLTAFVAAIDRASGRMVYTNAGHPAALIARADGSVEKLASFGMPLALMRSSSYTSREVVLDRNATLLLYTDGITEAANRGDDEYGLERLTECFARNHRCTLEELFQRISTDLDRFVGGEPYVDDLTVLMVRRL
jgi:sigma-B regulation protein RsbU (phosphoserine phosphatase)